MSTVLYSLVTVTLKDSTFFSVNWQDWVTRKLSLSPSSNITWTGNITESDMSREYNILTIKLKSTNVSNYNNKVYQLQYSNILITVFFDISINILRLGKKTMFWVRCSRSILVCKYEEHQNSKTYWCAIPNTFTRKKQKTNK